jgi:hypothetical protein
MKRDEEDKFWVSLTGDSERLRVDPGLSLPVQPTDAVLVERLPYSHTNQRKRPCRRSSCCTAFLRRRLGRAGFLVTPHPLSKAILVEAQA